MLHRGPEASEQEAGEERGEAPRHPRHDEAERGDGGAGREQTRLAPALGEHSRRDLEGRHPARVAGPQEPDLREAEPELRLQMGRST